MSTHSLTQSFRRAKFGSAAALAVAGATLFFPHASRSMELSEVTLQTDCRAEALKRINEHKPFIFAWDGKCEIVRGDLAQKAKEAAIAHDKAADARAAAADLVQTCLDKLIAYRATDPDGFKRLGKITRENVCEISKRAPAPVASTVKPSAG